MARIKNMANRSWNRGDKNKNQRKKAIGFVAQAIRLHWSTIAGLIYVNPACATSATPHEEDA
jgi:hypothetical protein